MQGSVGGKPQAGLYTTSFTMIDHHELTATYDKLNSRNSRRHVSNARNIRNDRNIRDVRTRRDGVR
jgi:hypothetical protein